MRVYKPGDFVHTEVSVGIEPATRGNPDAKVTGSFQVVLHTKPHDSPFNGYMAADAKLRVPARMSAAGQLEVKGAHRYDTWDHFHFHVNPLAVDLARARREGVKVLIGGYEVPVVVP
jgi:hypothetical protein